MAQIEVLLLDRPDDMADAPIGISVVIPVYNGGTAFRHCLASLAASDRLPDEVIVVADGDSDGSWRVAEEFGVRLLRLEACGGPARARNLGAGLAQGEVIFFVDADVTLHHDTIAQVAQRFASQPNLVALIGSYDDEPGASNFLSQYKNLFHHYTHQTSSPRASTFWGACGAIRREVFERVGGFDEDYRCVEDIELGYRLTQAGYPIALYKDIQVKHLKRWEVRSLLRAEIFCRALPWAEIILRDRQLNADLNLNHSSRASVVLVFALVASLGLTPWWPLAAAAAVGLGLGLLVLNRDVYWFFYRKRGPWFALRVLPWHWLYFFYGGGAFAVATLRHYLPGRLRPARA